MRWGMLIGLMFALVIVPFVLFESEFERLGAWLAEAGFTAARHVPLPADPEAKGPAMFAGAAVACASS